MLPPVALVLLSGLVMAAQQVPVHAHVFVVVPASRGFSPGMDTLAVAGELKSRCAAPGVAFLLPVSLVFEHRLATPLLQKTTASRVLQAGPCNSIQNHNMQGTPPVRDNS
jgi:hypothetical protein